MATFFGSPFRPKSTPKLCKQIDLVKRQDKVVRKGKKRKREGEARREMRLSYRTKLVPDTIRLDSKETK